MDGTTLGVSTGVDGDYAINIPDAKGKTLVFSMIGLAEKRIVIGNNAQARESTESARTVCFPAEGRSPFVWMPRRSLRVRLLNGRTVLM